MKAPLAVEVLPKPVGIDPPLLPSSACGREAWRTGRELQELTSSPCRGNEATQQLMAIRTQSGMATQRAVTEEIPYQLSCFDGVGGSASQFCPQ